MDPVEYQLKLVIYRWCGASPVQYTQDSVLGDIWTAHIPQIGYEPEGIRRFFMTLYADPFFSGCDAAHHLTPGEFFAGGDLQTVVQVYRRLISCGNTPVDPAAQGSFQ